MSKLDLTTEFSILFLLLPLATRFAPVRLPLLPLLWLATLYCWLTLRHDPTFARAALWNSAAIAPNLISVLATFAAIGLVLTLSARCFAPQLLFTFVRSRPALWALVMVLYPILSVYPQGIVYRAFLMHRYASLFPNPVALILVSAAAFGFMHLVFRNPIAPHPHVARRHSFRLALPAHPVARAFIARTRPVRLSALHRRPRPVILRRNHPRPNRSIETVPAHLKIISSKTAQKCNVKAPGPAPASKPFLYNDLTESFCCPIHTFERTIL